MYPISLRIDGKPCYVIGGGKVAERKVEGLLAAGGKVHVISPHATEKLQSLYDEGRITLAHRCYQEGDLEGAMLVFAATDDESVHLAVCREAERRGLWVNDAMSPERATFHVPAVLRRGELQIAVSTSGAVPMLASRVRDEIAHTYDERYARYVELLGKLRQKLQQHDLSDRERRELYRRWIEDQEQIMEALGSDHTPEQLEELMDRLLRIEC